MPEQQTRVLADRYELIAPLGRGTMGTVWRAYDRSLGREVAVKEIRQESGLSEAQRAELRERMIREGRTAARISHPSVATVHDAIIENGSPWIIMELVQARSLEQVIEEEGPLPPRLVAEIGVDLLGALRAAHAQGVLHRDVKPGNVLITESGRVVLTDFGIAKAEGDTNLTKTGMVIGSPGYTAPERARGEHTGPESDLWSLGATLYFAVEGRPAYERSSVAETLAALMTDRADPPTQAGPLRPVLEQLLERDHTVRLAPAQAAAMLRAVADTPSTSVNPASATPAIPLKAAAPVKPVTPATPTPPVPAAAPPAGEEGEEFDADRTMLVIRPKNGLRLPGAGPAPVAAEPPPVPGPQGPPGPSQRGNPAPGGRGPSAPGTPVAWGPGSPAEPRTGVSPDGHPTDRGRLPGHADPAPPGSWQRPGPGGPGADHPQPGPGAPGGAHPWQPGPGTPGMDHPRQPGPGTPGGAHPWQPGPGTPGADPPRRPGPGASDRGHGLGTELFAIAGQGGKGEQTTTPARTRTGLIVLMGVAAVALVVIVIVAVAVFANKGRSGAAPAVPHPAAAAFRDAPVPAAVTRHAPAGTGASPAGDEHHSS
ncbi:serine/threonine-protein kinase [Streptosporangium roseum]|uniref:non-specific serine/threonine protein kinase n=1 Tax=Streptosporangium roseum (strain ATCC 12428 / DSM 43021 / JCM 3005 / KCTC 9067 / NCIMB 10171 / NRRL 2505 / NI 9100) TaxID=479432 RepID=D2B2C7_STRRD|nr:serine/threonine-protein kinase [Streptosporangium roseum]ACZ91153.1 Serine/threonine protein kinase-like protein [Streptosporangium roseum DSM 43021]